MNLAKLIPRQIAVQLAALMVLAVVVFHLTMTFAFMIFPPHFGPPPPEQRNGPMMERGIEIYGPIDPRDGFDPHWFPPHPPHMFIDSFALLASIVFLTISLIIFGFWAARSLIAPLKRFALAAEQYRANGGNTALVEEGPTEIRTLARALNEMHVRVTTMMADRTRMLAAIGHDLRTPITRLRLRAEFMQNAHEQRRMLADLDHMEALVRGALTHLQDGQTGEGLVAANLVSLLQTILDQFGDLGLDVGYAGPDRVVARIKPHEFQRAITNLVENAIRYGEDPQIRVARGTNGDLEVSVEDSGPGISDGLKAMMLEPFARGDTARTMNEFEGFGLGLAIARSIAEAHGGRLELRDRRPRGLAAVVTLPATHIVYYDVGNVQPAHG